MPAAGPALLPVTGSRLRARCTRRRLPGFLRVVPSPGGAACWHVVCIPGWPCREPRVGGKGVRRARFERRPESWRSGRYWPGWPCRRTRRSRSPPVRTSAASSRRHSSAVPEMERGRLAIEDGAGARIAAATPFDLQVRASLHGGRQSLPPGGGAGALVAAASVTTTASAVKAFRSGVVVSSELSLGRLRAAGIFRAASQADSSVSVLVPLAGGRGGGAATGAERAAERSYRGAVLDREHISARAVLDAVVAYWRYAAAYERLRTYGESTARAQRLVEETEALIAADERPTSDRDVMASNLASKRTTETAAEETFRDARYALGLSMGLTVGAIAGLGPPATGFPLPAGAGHAVAAVAFARDRHPFGPVGAARSGCCSGATGWRAPGVGGGVAGSAGALGSRCRSRAHKHVAGVRFRRFRVAVVQRRRRQGSRAGRVRACRAQQHRAGQGVASGSVVPHRRPGC